MTSDTMRLLPPAHLVRVWLSPKRTFKTMCTSQLVLLQLFLLMVPEGVGPQSFSSQSEAVPTPSDLGLGSQGATPQSSSEGSESPGAVPGTFATVVTPSAPGNRTVDLFPGEGRRCGKEQLT